MAKEVKIRDYDYGVSDPKVGVVKVSAHVLSFEWPCGDLYEVKWTALSRMLDVIEVTGTPRGIRVGATAEEAVRRVSYSHNRHWEPLALVSIGPTLVLAIRGDLETTPAGENAKFSIKDLRKALAL